MQSLAKRHDDRIARKAANRSEFQGDTAPSVATAVNLARAAADAVATLGEAGAAEFEQAMQGYEGVSARSLSEAPDGSGDTMAGIGVINTKVVPAGVLAAAEEGNGGGGGFKRDGGWGDTAPPTVEPTPAPEKPNGNLNGKALSDQGAAP
jgi:hypothetical protein